MPVINIEYDNRKISDKEALLISKGIQKIVSDITKIEDVPVYANSAAIKVKVAPIEIFVEMSAYKITDAGALTIQIKKKILAWKKENKFPHPINLTVIPMNWKVEINI